MADHNSRIVISANADDIKKVVAELEKLRDADEKTSIQFKKSHDKRKKEHKEQLDMNKLLGESFEELGKRIVQAFAFEQVIEFGQECIKAFEEAQQAEKQLEFAVKNLAGGDEGSFKELREQSEKLSESLNNLFSPKQIQQSQATLLRMKFNTEQVAQIMPRIADIAAKTGKDLNTVAEGFGRAISEGNTKALTEFGLKFHETGNFVGNFNKVMESSKKYINGAAEAMNDYAAQEKEAANKAEILQEQLGSKLAPVWIKIKTSIMGAISSEIDFFKTMADGLSGKQYDWQDLGKQFINGLGYFFTAGLIHVETTAEQMEEISKKSTKVIIGLAEQTRKEIEEAAKRGDALEVYRLQIKSRTILQLLQERSKTEIKEEENIDKYLRDHKDKADAMSIAQLKAYQKVVLDNEKAFSAAGFEQEKSAIEQAIKRVEEAGKKKAEEAKKLHDKQLKEEADFYKKDEELLSKMIDEMIAEAHRKLKLDEEINNLIVKKEEQTNEAVLESQKLALKKKFDEGKIDKEKYDKQIRELENKNQVENDRLELDALKENQEKKKNQLAIDRSENLISEEEYQKQLLEMDVEYGDAQIKLQKDINKSVFDLKADEAKNTQELIEGLHEFTETILEALNESINSNIEAIDTQMERQDKMIDVQKTLAEKGLANDLAFEERRADELEKKRLEEQRKLKKAKELETFLNALAKYASENPNTALMKAAALLAGAKITETLFMEDGGIIGQTSQKSSIGLGAFSRRHKTGGDLLIHAQQGEGVIPKSVMQDWGLTTQSKFSSFLRNPFKEVPLPSHSPVNIFNDSKIVNELQAVKEAIGNIQQTHWTTDAINNLIETKIKEGLTTRTTHQRRLI